MFQFSRFYFYEKGSGVNPWIVLRMLRSLGYFERTKADKQTMETTPNHLLEASFHVRLGLSVTSPLTDQVEIIRIAIQ